MTNIKVKPLELKQLHTYACDLMLSEFYTREYKADNLYQEETPKTSNMHLSSVKITKYNYSGNQLRSTPPDPAGPRKSVDVKQN